MTTEYLTNSQGHLVPKTTISSIDLLRDDTVNRIVDLAKEVQAVMKDFKHETFSDITAFVDTVAEQYDTKLGGRKGNLSLASYNGKYKVVVAISDSLNFDERLHVAKQLIDECLHKWSEGSNDKVKALIEFAFQTDKQGNINVARIFSLMRMRFKDKDEQWDLAMKALKDSVQVTASCQYLRIYERVGNTDKYKQISLDIAGL